MVRSWIIGQTYLGNTGILVYVGEAALFYVTALVVTFVISWVILRARKSPHRHKPLFLSICVTMLFLDFEPATVLAAVPVFIIGFFVGKLRMAQFSPHTYDGNPVRTILAIVAALCGLVYFVFWDYEMPSVPSLTLLLGLTLIFGFVMGAYWVKVRDQQLAE